MWPAHPGDGEDGAGALSARVIHPHEGSHYGTFVTKANQEIHCEAIRLLGRLHLCASLENAVCFNVWGFLLF